MLIFIHQYLSLWTLKYFFNNLLDKGRQQRFSKGDEGEPFCMFTYTETDTGMGPYPVENPPDCTMVIVVLFAESSDCTEMEEDPCP